MRELGTTVAELKTGYEGLRPDTTNMVKARSSNMRGDSLDYWIFQYLCSNNRLVESLSTCHLRDEYRRNPLASGDFELAHVERAYARLGEKLRRYYSLNQLKICMR